MKVTGKGMVGLGRAVELRAENVELAYGRHIAVSGFNLDVPLGRITAVVGPNGSGKSTILRALARLLRPRTGDIYLDGRAIHRLPTREVARHLAILPQGPVAPEVLTVEALIWHGRYPHQGFLGVAEQNDREAVAHAIAVTEMAEFTDRFIGTLSAGERQRAWIAMTLAQETPILLLDEPTTFLDVRHQIEVMELLKSLNAEHGITIVMVLHDLNQAARYSHCLVAVRDGRVRRVGTPAEILTPELLREVFGVEGSVIFDPDTGVPVCLPRALAAKAYEPNGDAEIETHGAKECKP
ncbi:MAG: ABC transporter ATP-binding protein [Candidatus Methylomirabilales bacterium]